MAYREAAALARVGGISPYLRYRSASSYDNTKYIKIAINANFQLLTKEQWLEALTSLEEVATEHNLNLFATNPAYMVQDYDYVVCDSFYLVEGELDDVPGNRDVYGGKITIGKTIVCPFCGVENSQHKLVCQCGNRQVCRGCATNVYTAVRQHQEFELREQNCSICASICTQCNTPYMRDTRLRDMGDGLTICYTCQPRFSCRNCGEIEHGVNPDRYCATCVECQCARCNNIILGAALFEHEDQNYCANCYRRMDGNDEVFDDDVEMPATRLALPTIEGRERIRFCGIEIEGNNVTPNAHETLAILLNEAQLSDFDNRRGYHERYNGGFAHVERDASCDWEVVAGPINMADTQDVRNLNKLIKIIREQIKNKTVKLGLNCGLHVHVSAEKVGIKQAHNLHLLYTYLEDIFYRLGAAKWPMHRAIINGDEIYRVSPRTDNKLNFVNTYVENRYYGLSFSNYFQKMFNSCACGAGRFGMFDECTCALTKCTFEFRIFNTTANTKKIHAFLSLTQALVAKALSMDEFDLEEMPEHQYNIRNFKDMDATEQEEIQDKWQERMKFIFEELPLTDGERDSILYCVENSELESIMGFCNEIINANVEVV